MLPVCIIYLRALKMISVKFHLILFLGKEVFAFSEKRVVLRTKQIGFLFVSTTEGGIVCSPDL